MAVFVAFFLFAIGLGTLIEYLLHRFFLHSRLRNWLTRRHKLHHKTSVRYSLLSEFAGFFPGAVPFLWIGFIHSPAAGGAFVLGSVAYVFLVALCHKWSHEAPGRLFWLNPNVHALHHARGPKWNFGVTTAFWDRVFGTYRVPPARPPGAGQRGPQVKVTHHAG
jgi:sterol desaturase/sphingolipid hydroxylase (fatty acid hydroxylase superfamily)